MYMYMYTVHVLHNTLWCVLRLRSTAFAFTMHAGLMFLCKKNMFLSVFYASVVHALKMTNAHVTEYILLACVHLEIDMC